MSWRGNYSHIYDKFFEDEDYSRVKYWRGIDEYIYKEIDHNTYNDKNPTPFYSKRNS